MLCAFVFMLFFMVTCYKLIGASLWYDEAVEYWYSRVMLGPLPFSDVGNSMYDRIIYTFQPPLYNLVMFLWLKVNEGEWWFRFFGVIMGFFSMIPLYRTSKVIANTWAGLAIVVLCTFNYHLQYYWQECAEYCLAICMLCWSIYYWVRYLKTPDGRNATWFTIFCVLSVYSQYGMAFPIAVMALLAFLRAVASREKGNVLGVTVRYLIAIICAGLPLFIFFLKPQMLHQESAQLAQMTFTDGILRDMESAFSTELRVNFLQSLSTDEQLLGFVMYLLLALMVIALVFGRDSMARFIIIANIVTWLLYYFSAKLGIYVHNHMDDPFGRRYSLFLIPMWMLLFTGIGAGLWSIIRQHLHVNLINAKYCIAGMLLCIVFCYSFMGWNTKLQAHWSKENNRDLVGAWYEADAQASNTFVYYSAKYGFSYYVKHSDQYTEHTEDNVHYMTSLRNLSEDEYTAYINDVYGDNWPREIYFAMSHTVSDYKTITKCFKSAGYKSKEIYKGRRAKLVRFVKK